MNVNAFNGAILVATLLSNLLHDTTLLAAKLLINVHPIKHVLKANDFRHGPKFALFFGGRAFCFLAT